MVVVVERRGIITRERDAGRNFIRVALKNFVEMSVGGRWVGLLGGYGHCWLGGWVGVGLDH